MKVEQPQSLDFETTFYESVLSHVPAYAAVIEILGTLYTKAGRIEEGLTMDEQLVALRPESALAHYNLSCSLTLTGQIEEALLALKKAIDLGYSDAPWMLKDPDLDGLRDLPAFHELVDYAKEKQDQTEV